MSDLFSLSPAPPASVQAPPDATEHVRDEAAWAQAERIGKAGFPRGGWEEMLPGPRHYYQCCYYWAILDGTIKREE